MQHHVHEGNEATDTEKETERERERERERDQQLRSITGRMRRCGSTD
jgi:hypothetical protein